MKPALLIRDRANQLTRTGMSYDDAFQQAQRENPEAVAAIANRAKSPSEFANEQAELSRQTASARKSAARTEFLAMVHARMKSHKQTYDQSLRYFSQERPDLANEMNTPVFTPTMCTMLGLNPNATQEEATTAWKANGCVLSPVDYQKIHTGLSADYQQKQGWAASVADEKVSADHPRLADAVRTLKP